MASECQIVSICGEFSQVGNSWVFHRYFMGISFKEIMAMPLAPSPLDAPPPAVLWLERSAKKDRKVDEVYGDCRVNLMPWAMDDDYLKIKLAFFCKFG